MKYQMKPVVIEAFQMTKERGSNNIDWPDWLHIAWNTTVGEGSLGHIPDIDDHAFVLGTLEGPQRVPWGAWIIRRVEGDLDIVPECTFARMYEEA